MLRLGMLTIFMGWISCSKQPMTICDQTIYPSWETSNYVLPYPIGERYLMVQGNCSDQDQHWHWNSHTQDSPWLFAYDFEMPIGTIITATRAGEVVYVRSHFTDADKNLDEANVVIIKHRDESYAAYGHLTHQGALVQVSQFVQAGDTIGISGNSGLSFIPHLHFQVSPCLNGEACGSLPITFRNTSPNSNGLVIGKYYKALPYE